LAEVQAKPQTILVALEVLVVVLVAQTIHTLAVRELLIKVLLVGG
jgi:hypothetical protein